MPKFSIIIPVYNNSMTIVEALESALCQNYHDFEIIVSDNASTDGSGDLIDGYDDPRLKKNLFSDNVPKTDNWDRAYRLASDSEYLVMLHADDVLEPDALTRIDKVTSKKPVLVYGRFGLIDINSKLQPEMRFPLSYATSGPEFQELMLFGNIVAVPHPYS